MSKRASYSFYIRYIKPTADTAFRVLGIYLPFRRIFALGICFFKHRAAALRRVPTVALLTPPTFKNKKESKGYWF